jgi:hypothetical protein
MSTATTLHTLSAAPARASAARRTLLPAFALLALTFGAAHADDFSSRDFRSIDAWANGRLVDVQVRVDNQAAPLYFAPGRDDRRYFQAFAGRNYSIVLHNTTGRRVAVLLAVDGLNAVNGEITRLSPNEDMYVLDPYEQATIRGWRTSLDEVRRFVFVDEQRSYAERTGQANSDMGWLRVLTFNEQLPWWQTRRDLRSGTPRFMDPRRTDAPNARPVPLDEAPRAQADSKDGAPEATKSMAPEAQNNLQGGGGSFPGTGWGERKEDHVQRTRFTPNPVAVDQLILRYEYASGLQALGIVPVRRFRDRLGERDGEMGFAKPPRW